MGNPLSMLTQYDIEEVQQHYRSGRGFISSDEFLSIPEFAVNPLSQRLLKIINGLNFKEFVSFLSTFSSGFTREQKIEFIFKIYDLNCNGQVTFNDIMNMLRDLTGTYISEQQRQQVLTQLLKEAGYTEDSVFVLEDFVKILSSSGLKMEVEVPVD
ncbi:hypothetical protein C5167_042242 [Papaver somniferum]|uniref:EF-hand domain-containing protein n=1 Tax=Papaver somniferum TaxID=3469 RepID=A0A4Y7L3A7_PAPSO|nr:hypothetical protein C5167_042242 [Papaver somniferum]